MIIVTILKHSGEYAGYQVQGHAGYARKGEDIICSAVSVLTINAANSIEEFTDDSFSAKCSDGFLEAYFEGRPSETSKLLMDSMILGLRQIQKDYGEAYIHFEYKEV